MATWDEMTPRERDAWVAENVMGWEREPDEQHPGANVAWFKPPVGQRGENTGTTILSSTAKPFTTDASADYLVLQKVRETWTGEPVETFCDALFWIIQNEDRKKRHGSTLMDPDWVWKSSWIAWYEPGDYSHAAYLALTDTP